MTTYQSSPTTLSQDDDRKDAAMISNRPGRSVTRCTNLCAIGIILALNLVSLASPAPAAAANGCHKVFVPHAVTKSPTITGLSLGDQGQGGAIPAVSTTPQNAVAVVSAVGGTAAPDARAQPDSASSAPLASASSPSSPYGMTDWNWHEDAIVAAQEMGVNWMRVYVNWQEIEVIPGCIDWMGRLANVRDVMARAKAHGMQVTASVSLAPAWAKQPGLFLPQPQLLANFIRALLQRFPGQIAAVEVLAEESTVIWPATKNRDAILYVPILQAAYQAVKEVSPSTLVTTASLWGSPEGYLEDLYSLGAGDYFDVVNFHYYPGAKPPSVNFNWWINHLKKVMARHGDGAKPVWLTEFAWTATDEWRLDGANSIIPPQQVVDNMVYVLDSSMKSGIVSKVFWYVMHDDDGMALMHSTNNYAWKTPQPALVADVQDNSTTLTVAGDWTKRWPQYGTLVVDQEQIGYASLSFSSGSTQAQALSRGVSGTTAASHGAGVTVYNRDQTADFKRQTYYAYQAFSRAHPTWGPSDIAPLPDVTLPSSGPISVRNPGFEGGKVDWSSDNYSIDLTEKHSGSASARMENTTGTWKRASQPVLTVEPDRTYFLKAWVKIDPNGSGDMYAMVMANLNDSTGKFLTVVPGNYYIYGTAGVWRQIAYPFRTPLGATQLIPFLSTDKGTGVAWFDDISIETYDVTSHP